MKFATALILIFLSFSTFAQNRFKVSKDRSTIRNLKSVKAHHQMILQTYRKQIESEIIRLATGIEYESGKKSNAAMLKGYQSLMVNLVVKRIFVKELEKQLRPVDLDKYRSQKPPTAVFNTDAIKINLHKEMNIHLDEVLDKESLGHYFIKDLKGRLIRETASTVAVKTYKAIGSGLLAKIVTSGISTAALKSAVFSIGSEVFVSAGTGSILNILTFPLHAYRLPPESIWIDILHKHPELIINPEWMKYAGSQDEPWSTHSYAIFGKTKAMERSLQTLLNNEEKDFIRSVIAISKLDKVVETKTDTPNFLKKPVIDNTYVHRSYVIQDLPPFWASR
jgi:hypothetical protein